MTNEELNIILKKLEEFTYILIKQIKESKEVFITTHKNPDFDAISSALAIALIAKQLKKDAYIIIDNHNFLDSKVKAIIDANLNEFSFITTDIYNNIKSENDLLIITDTNKKSMVSCKDYLSNFKKIIIIDHHLENQDSITANYKFVNTNLSSTAEIVTTILNYLKIEYNKDIANYLLSGIVLDNLGNSNKASRNTFFIISKLMNEGADLNYVNTLFEENFENDRKVHDLIDVTEFTDTSAICCGKKEIIYTKEELAKAANYLTKFKHDFNCAIGYVDKDHIGLSSRSNGKINASKIMELFGGGGDLNRAAAQIKENDIKKVKEDLVKVLKLQIKTN